jgi:membrane protein implicated in regulation of membrane protease activity
LIKDIVVYGREMRKGGSGSEAPLFSSARFDQDTLIIYPLFSATVVVMYLLGFGFFSIVPALVLAAIFVIEGSERVLEESLQERQLVGAQCRVMRHVSRGESGVVEILDRSGAAQWELWSAESDTTLDEGSLARVRGTRGIFLQIEPL